MEETRSKVSLCSIADALCVHKSCAVLTIPIELKQYNPPPGGTAIPQKGADSRIAYSCTGKGINSPSIKHFYTGIIVPTLGAVPV